MKDVNSLFRGSTGFGQIIDHSVAEYPDRTAIISGETRLTYRELGEQAARFALALERDGVGPGDPVAVISRNCAEFLVAEFAILKLGAVVVKINWRFSPDEIQYLFDLNRIHHVVARYERKDWAHTVWLRNHDHIKFYLLNPDHDGRSPFEKALDRFPSAQGFTPREVDLDAPAFRVHTSGTTGKPKCVLHTHGRMLEELRSCLSVLAFGPGEVYQVVSQLFHISSVGSYMTLATGGTLVLMSRFEPTEYLESLEREKVTGVGIIPVVLKRLLEHPDLAKYDLSHLKFLNYSTCPMSPALLDEAMRKLSCDFYQPYGMTEMASILTVLSPEAHHISGGKYLSSVGKPIPGAQIRIEAPDGSLCAPGETGEIVARGPGQMVGYYKADPELNARALRDGWYHTGDIGRLDEEGYLYVSGRKDDMIISGGENIYPKEIMDVIMALTGDVAEAAVYGVPDDDWGERVKASVVLLPGSTLTTEKLREYCKSYMPRYKVPKEIEFLEELPKNSTGKVLIQALKDRS